MEAVTKIMPKLSFYRFPEYFQKVPSDIADRRKGIEDAKEELEEALDAVPVDTVDDPIPYICELLDALHAIETLLREYDDDMVECLAKAVTMKNRERGMYE